MKHPVRTSEVDKQRATAAPGVLTFAANRRSGTRAVTGKVSAKRPAHTARREQQETTWR
jgi:hypothetical protein